MGTFRLRLRKRTAEKTDERQSEKGKNTDFKGGGWGKRVNDKGRAHIICNDDACSNRMHGPVTAIKMRANRNRTYLDRVVGV